MKRLLRWILRLFPEDMDGISRRDVEETFMDGYAASGFSVVFAVREIWGLVRTGLRERIMGWKERRISALSELPFEVGRDLRLAFRSLGRSPGFTVAAALTVALGIGSTTVVFSFVNGILLSPLPFRDPGRLVAFSTFHGRSDAVSEPEFLELRSGARSLESVAATESFSRILQVNGEPTRVTTLAVTHELLPLLGVQPLLGRDFTRDEDAPGGPRVAILSHALWQEMFGGDPGVLGRSISLGGSTYHVVGVMPPGFYFPSPETALWTPYRINAAAPDRWNNHHVIAYARLKNGVSLNAARTEVRAMGERMVAEHGEFLAGLGFTLNLTRLSDRMFGSTRAPLLVLLVAVSLLLLVGCSNVANLVLARGESRRHEVALRAALGASRRRLLVNALVENLALASLGGTAGVGMAVLGIRGIRAVAGDTIPRIQDVGVDVRVLAFSAGATILAGLLFGLMPAVAASRLDLQRSLTEGGRSASGSRRTRNTRRMLVASEVALSVVLVIGAGVMLRSVAKLYGSNPGFRTDDVLTARVSLPGGSGSNDEDPSAFYARLLARVRALPGVSSAGAVERLPLLQPLGLSSIQIGGKEVTDVGDAPVAEAEQVTPGYFPTMGVTLREGRLLRQSDDGSDPPVAVINEAFQRQLLPDGHAVGRRIRFFASGSPWMRVVGVVADERQGGLATPVRPKMYVPHAQAALNHRTPARTMTLVVYGRAVDGLAAPIRALVHEMNTAAPVDHVETMTAVKARSMTDRSYPTLLLTAFGLLALVLASVGIYGLVAFDVTQHRHDIGVHVAVGATGAQVERMLVGSGLRPVVIGLAAGLLCAVGVTRLLGSLLYGVDPLDLPVFVGAPAVLLAVATAASFLPVRKATRLDPAQVLRSE